MGDLGGEAGDESVGEGGDSVVVELDAGKRRRGDVSTIVEDERVIGSDEKRVGVVIVSTPAREVLVEPKGPSEPETRRKQTRRAPSLDS